MTTLDERASMGIEFIAQDLETTIDVFSTKRPADAQAAHVSRISREGSCPGPAIAVGLVAAPSAFGARVGASRFRGWNERRLEARHWRRRRRRSESGRRG